MIEGLKVCVSSEELVKHLRSRAAMRADHAFKCREKMKELGKMADTEKLSTDALHSAQRASYFKFLADHVAENEQYQLSEAELQNLELGWDI